MRVLLELFMAGQGWGLPPKRIRRDQWIADAAVVHAVQLEIFTGADFIESEWFIVCGEKLDFGISCGKGRVRTRGLCAGPGEISARRHVASPCGAPGEGEKAYSDQTLMRARTSHLQA